MRMTAIGESGGCTCGRALRFQLAALGAAAAVSCGTLGDRSSAAAAAARLNASEIGSAALSWGQNGTTDLGAGYKSDSEPGPVSVVGLTNVAAIAAGFHFSLALLAEGTVE